MQLLKQLHYFLLLFCLFSIIILQSCSDDEMNNSNPDDTLNCLGSPEHPVSFRTCDSRTIDTTQYCTLNYKGDHNLSDDAKSYASFYCDNIGRDYKYISEDGDELTLSLTDKSYSKISRLLGILFTCPEDSTLLEGFCYEGETILGELTSSDNSIVINIVIKHNIIPSVEGLEDVFETIQLSLNPSLPVSLANDFSLNLNGIGLPLPSFYEDISLNGISFQNIYSNENNLLFSAPNTFYFSREKGVVGFKQENGPLYALNE